MRQLKEESTSGEKVRMAKKIERWMLEVAHNGLRWANNIIVEVGSNYGHVFTDDGRNHLSDAIKSLAKAMDEVKKDELRLRQEGR